jgi:hypothetical protein
MYNLATLVPMTVDRVIRFDEFLPLGRLFTFFGQFFLITGVAQVLGLLFRRKIVY